SASSNGKGFGGSGGTGPTSVGADSGGNSGTLSGGGCGFMCNTSSSSGPGAGLDITPKDVTLTVKPQTLETQTFKVMSSGVDVTAQVSWSYERPDVGDVTMG